MFLKKKIFIVFTSRYIRRVLTRELRGGCGAEGNPRWIRGEGEVRGGSVGRRKGNPREGGLRKWRHEGGEGDDVTGNDITGNGVTRNSVTRKWHHGKWHHGKCCHRKRCHGNHGECHEFAGMGPRSAGYDAGSAATTATAATATVLSRPTTFTYLSHACFLHCAFSASRYGTRGVIRWHAEIRGRREEII